MLYITIVLNLVDVDASGNSQQHLFAHPNVGTPGAPSSKISLVTAPSSSDAASMPFNYVSIQPSAHGDNNYNRGNFLGWTYAINSSAVCDATRGGTVTNSATAPCAAGLSLIRPVDYSAADPATLFLRLQFQVATYSLLAVVSPAGSGCGTLTNARTVSMATTSLSRALPSCRTKQPLAAGVAAMCPVSQGGRGGGNNRYSRLLAYDRSAVCSVAGVLGNPTTCPVRTLRLLSWFLHGSCG